MSLMLTVLDSSEVYQEGSSEESASVSTNYHYVVH